MSLLTIQTAGPPAPQPATAAVSAGDGAIFAALVAGMTGTEPAVEAPAGGKPLPADRQQAADPQAAPDGAAALLAMIDSGGEGTDPAPADAGLAATVLDAAPDAMAPEDSAPPITCGWMPVKAPPPVKAPVKMPAPLPAAPVATSTESMVPDTGPDPVPAAPDSASDGVADRPADPVAAPAGEAIAAPLPIAAAVTAPAVEGDAATEVARGLATARMAMPMAVPDSADPMVAAPADEARLSADAADLPRTAQAPGATPAPSIPIGPPRSDAAAAQMLAALVTGDAGDRADTERTSDAFAQALGGIRAALAGMPPRVEPPAAVMRAPPLDTGRAEWIAALVERIDTQRAEGSRIAHLKLRPDALGGVEVRIRQEGERIHVAFATETAQARSLLADAAPRLAELADARGLKLGDTGVQQQEREAGGERRAAPDRLPDAPAPAAAAPATDAAAPSGRIA